MPFPEGFADATEHWSTLYSYTQQEYDRLAARYRGNFKHLLPKDKNARILDVGSAGGFFLYFLRKEGYTDVRGIDPDERAVLAAQKMNLPVTKEDAFRFLEKATASYDCITINQVLEHFPRETSASLLRLIHGALRPGGLLIASVPNAMNPAVGYQMFEDLSHEHLYTPKSLAVAVVVAGFDHVAVHPEGPVAYDWLTAARWLLWKMREAVLQALFAIDVGIGRANRVHRIFTLSLIVTGEAGTIPRPPAGESQEAESKNLVPKGPS
jgi:2-polyprenyl-3-methyl-5-hydroxy-6-metoxy-1,4-benzoquinol methylase